MVAFSARRLVCAEIAVIASVTLPISLAATPSCRITVDTVWVCAAAASLIERDFSALAAISPTVALISSVAPATESNFAEACPVLSATDAELTLNSSAAAATLFDLLVVSFAHVSSPSETAESPVEVA